MNCAKTSRARAEGGFVLIASLLMLLVLTFLAVGMYHSFRVQETMAANTKEKARAYQIAESTELYAEYLLTNDLALLAQNNSCPTTAHLTVAPGTVCQGVGVNIQPPSSGGPMTLANGQIYSTMTPALTLSTTGGSSAGGGTYYDYPQFYIQYLGLSANGQGQVYQITALGYGGNANAVAVVQSIFQLTSGIKNLGGL
jgi:type IV pilus assembly protein PilX